MAKKYSLSRKFIEVELDDKPYRLVELTGKERDNYLNLSSTKIRTDAAGQPTGVKDFAGMFSDLLCFALEDDKGQKVSRDFVQGMPVTAQEDLFKQALELSGLDKDGQKRKEEEAKND